MKLSRFQCGNINSFHASVFLARQPMETGCHYPLNEDDPPVTRLVAMAPACHASPCPSLSPTFIRQHLPDNRMRWYSTRRQALGSDMERKHLPWSFHARFRSRYLHVGKGRKRDVCQQDHQPHCQIRSPLIHHGADYRQPHHQQPSSRRLKRTLKLPHGAEINMAIPCGIRDGNKGIWGERCRVPFEDVYRKL